MLDELEDDLCGTCILPRYLGAIRDGTGIELSGSSLRRNSFIRCGGIVTVECGWSGDSACTSSADE